VQIIFFLLLTVTFVFATKYALSLLYHITTARGSNGSVVFSVVALSTRQLMNSINMYTVWHKSTSTHRKLFIVT